ELAVGRLLRVALQVPLQGLPPALVAGALDLALELALLSFVVALGHDRLTPGRKVGFGAPLRSRVLQNAGCVPPVLKNAATGALVLRHLVQVLREVIVDVLLGGRVRLQALLDHVNPRPVRPAPPAPARAAAAPAPAPAAPPCARPGRGSRPPPSRPR